jgi:DNA-binding protein H-NS
MVSRKQLLEELQEIDARQAALAEQVQATRDEALSALAATFDEALASEGFSRQDLSVLWGFVRQKRAKERQMVRYVLSSDSEKAFSFRGPTPGWMKDAMTAEGMDPDVQAQRLLFRDRYMVPCAD